APPALPRRKPSERLDEILGMFGLAELNQRFFAPRAGEAASA
ncbi:SAM-dependent methyltransferase, partial [Burkholderia gladioli]|nr:SAM-dependent methyltransferase [Burkholderia gladioli]